MSTNSNSHLLDDHRSIGVDAARRIAAGAIAEATRHGWAVAVAIVDAAGDLVFFERRNGTQPASSAIAQDKARTAARFKRPTRTFEAALAGGRQAVLGIPEVVPLDGGLPLSAHGSVVGAIGVSGVTSQEDGTCAQAGADVLARELEPAFAVDG